MEKKFSEKEFLLFSQAISQKIYLFTKNYYKKKLLTGLTEIEYISPSNTDIKQEHKIDKLVKNYILDLINQEYSYLLKIANFCMEDYQEIKNTDAVCTIIIDPVDGSRCADQNIGDPCIMFAISFTPFNQMTFKDLASCFIKALHSGDTYFVYHQQSYYIPNNLNFYLQEKKVLLNDNPNNFVEVKPQHQKDQLPKNISDSVFIVRDGYGMRTIVKDKINHDILNQAKHTFSHDITSIELCYLTREVVHLIVEARKHYKNNKWNGSDGFNLIPYPLVKAVGGMIYDLYGKELENKKYNPYDIYDFIASTSPTLKDFFIKNSVNTEAVRNYEII